MGFRATFDASRDFVFASASCCLQVVKRAEAISKPFQIMRVLTRPMPCRCGAVHLSLLSLACTWMDLTIIYLHLFERYHFNRAQKPFSHLASLL